MFTNELSVWASFSAIHFVEYDRNSSNQIGAIPWLQNVCVKGALSASVLTPSSAQGRVSAASALLLTPARGLSYSHRWAENRLLVSL